MSNHDFVKGECRLCAGHLEFPADAAGQTIPCPHCGQLTELRAGGGAGKSRRSPGYLLITVVVILIGLAVVIAALLSGRKASPPEVMVSAPAPASTNVLPSVAAAAKPAIPHLKAGEELTNGFDISPIKLEKTPGSSLVYVTGKVKNLTTHQRFGVKVEFTLLDSNTNAIGRATDYQSVLDAKSDWDFKAMVMESKTVSARFSTILEDQ